MDDNSVECYWDKHQNNVYDKAKAHYVSFSDFIEKSTIKDFDTSYFGTYEALLHGNHIVNGYLIRKNIFEKTGGYTPEAPLEDYWIMLQIAKYAKMKYLREATFLYRWHANNTIIQGKKISRYTAQTLRAERNLTASLADKSFNALFAEFFEKKNTKILFSFFGKLVLYKYRTDFHKEIRLRIGSKEFLLLRRKYES